MEDLRAEEMQPEEMQPEEILHGGNTSVVVRVGHTVRRNTGHWTLDTASPRPLGTPAGGQFQRCPDRPGHRCQGSRGPEPRASPDQRSGLLGACEHQMSEHAEDVEAMADTDTAFARWPTWASRATPGLDAAWASDHEAVLSAAVRGGA